MEFTLHHLFTFNKNLKLSDLIWRTLKETQNFKYCSFPNGKIPQTLKEYDWYEARLKVIEKEISYLESLDEKGRHQKMTEELIADQKSYQKLDAYTKSKQAMRLELLNQLNAWKVSPELESLKQEIQTELEKYQIPDITKSPTFKNSQEWYQKRIEELYYDRQSNIEWQQKNKIETAQRNLILKELWSQFGPPVEGPICHCETFVLVSQGCQCGAAKQENGF